MENTKINLSIGIPAYNEGANIKYLLQSLLSQKNTNFILKEILIVSDGSTDNTIKEVESLNSPLIRIINHASRKGKVTGFNELISEQIGDFFVQFDADVRLADEYVLYNLVKTYQETGAGLVCAYVCPVEPKYFFEKVSYFGWTTWQKVLNLTKTDTLYHRCVGGCRGFSRDFSDTFRLPLGVDSAEDCYSFLYAKEKQYKIAWSEKAIVFYRLPTNQKDYIKQMNRFMHNDAILKRFFSDKMILKYSMVSAQAKLKALVWSCLTNSPLISCAYIITQLYAHYMAQSYVDIATWDTSTSTKKFD